MAEQAKRVMMKRVNYIGIVLFFMVRCSARKSSFSSASLQILQAQMARLDMGLPGVIIVLS